MTDTAAHEFCVRVGFAEAGIAATFQYLVELEM